MKTKLIKFFFINFLVFFSNNFAIAKTTENSNSPKKLILDEVTKSAITNYPEILKFYEKIETNKGKILQNKGFFDIKLKAQYQDKTRGFYDGKISDYSFEKQNEFLGSKIYGGYRKSFDDFAPYDGNYNTNSRGEYRIGGSVSLLRNREIDEFRLDLFNSELSFKETTMQLEKLKLDIKRDAIKSYYNWLTAGHIFKTYHDLYELAKHRQEQLKIRHQKGDIAKIILVENERNILQRNSLMLEAKNNFENSAIALSIYYRQTDGTPLSPKNEELPEINFINQEFSNLNISKDIEFALQNRPEMKIINIQKNIEQNNLLQAKNLYLPKLDLNFEASKDLGKGPISRSQGNNQIRLDFELPIQQNIAKGKILQSTAMLNLLKIEEQFLNDKIRNEIQQISNSIATTTTIFNNYLNEYKLSHILEMAERERFKQGNSEFFLINLREQEVASARINKLIAFLKYQSFKADYNVAIFRQ